MTIIGLSITLIGVSFAYYVSNFNILNKENSNSNISTGSVVEAILEIPEKVDNSNIYPGYKSAKEYIVKGKGNSKSIPTEASLIVKPNLGDFSKYVYWSLYKSDEEITCTHSLISNDTSFSNKSECDIPDTAKLVLSGNADTTHINMTVNYDTDDKYYLVTEYLDSADDQSELMGKKFNIDISLEKPEDSIQNKIIGELDTTGKCPTVNEDGTVNVLAAEYENFYLCSAPDNYGTSYYYRGNVQNNYVKFAGFYWRIVRINGDGSIRLIYDGTSLHANGEVSEDRQIGTSAFNETADDNAYVGYMYGTPGSSTYAETHANINDSTMKKYIDTWYENNLLDVSEYISDSDFYNDRSFSPYETKNAAGYSKIETAYHWHNPNYVIVEGDVWSFNPNSNFLTINKKVKNDIFNVKSGYLKYPIGLISLDELILAGGEIGCNDKFYMYSGQSYWTMSPYMFYGNAARFRIMASFGNLWIDAAANEILGVRPVISLKPDSLKSGEGTMSNPYVITEN